MIYNNNIISEYGDSLITAGSSPVPYQPKPTEDDYTAGFITRWFAKRINQVKAIEIDPNQQGGINSSLYAVVSLTWKISGPKYDLVVKGIVENTGVEKENRNEIERVKRESEVDLKTALLNPLELWRGY